MYICKIEKMTNTHKGNPDIQLQGDKVDVSEISFVNETAEPTIDETVIPVLETVEPISTPSVDAPLTEGVIENTVTNTDEPETTDEGVEDAILVENATEPPSPKVETEKKDKPKEQSPVTQPQKTSYNQVYKDLIEQGLVDDFEVRIGDEVKPASEWETMDKAVFDKIVQKSNKTRQDEAYQSQTTGVSDDLKTFIELEKNGGQYKDLYQQYAQLNALDETHNLDDKVANAQIIYQAKYADLVASGSLDMEVAESQIKKFIESGQDKELVEGVIAEQKQAVVQQAEQRAKARQEEINAAKELLAQTQKQGVAHLKNTFNLPKNKQKLIKQKFEFTEAGMPQFLQDVAAVIRENPAKAAEMAYLFYDEKSYKKDLTFQSKNKTVFEIGGKMGTVGKITKSTTPPKPQDDDGVFTILEDIQVLN